MSGLVGPWAEARRIVAVRLDAIGDVVMTTPAIRALAASHPDVRITLLTSPAGAGVAGLVDQIDDVIVHEASWMKGAPSGPSPAGGAADRALMTRLHAGRFDAAVIFTVHSQSALPAALMCHLAEIPLRLAHARENPYALLTDWVRDPEPDAAIRHEVRRQLDLVATIGATIEDDHVSVRVPDYAARAVRARLARGGLGRGPWGVIAPGATASSRRYPPERFAEAAGILAARDGWRFVVVGSAGERAVVDRVVALVPGALGLAGELGLPELAALIATAPILIANNSGPAHLAAAVGTPVVTLYALTNRQHAPWRVASRVLAHDVPCAGCRKSVCPEGHHRCLRGVPPAAVAEAALSLARGEPAPATWPAGILSGDPAPVPIVLAKRHVRSPTAPAGPLVASPLRW